MFWLAQKLQLRAPCDGRYFIQRVAASVGATAVRTAKRGPNKSPDFVAQDVNGVWHVIECKGTQSGVKYRADQLGANRPPRSGAIAQKRVIRFPKGHRGQRLACGLSLSVENRPDTTHLKIVDPTDEDDFRIREQDLSFAEDALIRSIVARILRLSGFEATSSVVAAPAGATASARPSSGPVEARRREIVEIKRTRARDELKVRNQREVRSLGDDHYRGREVSFDLPQPARISSGEVRTVRIRQGVNARLLDHIQTTDFSDEPLATNNSSWRTRVERMTFAVDETTAQIKIGDAFLAEIDLIIHG